jgi:hypothetical protein
MKHVMTAVALLPLLVSSIAFARADSPSQPPTVKNSLTHTTTSFRGTDSWEAPSRHANTDAKGCLDSSYKETAHVGCVWEPIQTSFDSTETGGD